MEQLEKFIQSRKKRTAPSAPGIFNLQKVGDRQKLGRLIKQNEIRQVVDDYEEQLKEYFQVMNPALVYGQGSASALDGYLSKLQKKIPLWRQGRWVYYPWLSTLVHILDADAFQKVRTARNQNLINKKEQAVFYNSVVGIGGLSVGNSVAMAIVLQGGARHIRLADYDRLALSNLNRIRAGVEFLGLNKVEMTARQIYALNPYAKVELFPNGLTPENIGKFFAGPPRLDVVIDELDNLAVKYLIREQARKYKTPVVMAADNGDNAVVDIERYDQNSRLPFFHNRMGKVTYEELKKLDKFGIGRTITKHIGPENVTIRMQESLLEMGKTIVSWPQLGGAALINGSAVAYCVRRILNKQPLEDNRALVSLDDKLIPGYDSAPEKKKRAQAAQAFKNIFKL